jgi:hypothetical protein
VGQQPFYRHGRLRAMVREPGKGSHPRKKGSHGTASIPRHRTDSVQRS